MNITDIVHANSISEIFPSRDADILNSHKSYVRAIDSGAPKIYPALLDPNIIDEILASPGAKIAIVDTRYGSCANGKSAKPKGGRSYYDNGTPGVALSHDVEHCKTLTPKKTGPNVTCIIYNFLLVVSTEARDCSGTHAHDEVPDVRGTTK